MEEVMRAVRADFETELVEFNGEPNHVHLLVNFPPKVALSRLVNSLKASRHGGCDRSSPSWFATTGGRSACGQGPTSPDRLAGRPSRCCVSTSSSRTVRPRARSPAARTPASAFTTGLKPGALADIPVAGAAAQPITPGPPR
jgi:hypothetical protein